MSETERQRELLREALAEEHRATGRRAPAFTALWSRAVAGRRPPRSVRRRRFALATAGAAGLALALAATLALWRAGQPGPYELERAITVAAGAADWQAPLDFLLETPGREWLEAPPPWTLEPVTEPWSLTPDLLAPDTHRRQ